MSEERDKSPKGARDPSGSEAAARTPGDAFSASGVPSRERIERERRRAVRAEARLAEVELALRRAVERGDGAGVSAVDLRSLLDLVQSRVALLEDEVRASENELIELAALQRQNRGELRADDEDLAQDLERARRELRDAVRAGKSQLPELTRQSVEFEVEIDRLQSILAYRDNICEGLTDELEQGQRATAEVSSRLADLSWGRVAPARRVSPQDARVATLRRDLEIEQAQLRQARRALETARAELKIAQRGVGDAEDRSEEQLRTLRRQLEEIEAERDRLRIENQHLRSNASSEAELARRALDEERAARARAAAQARNLAQRVEELERQLSMSGHEREVTVRARLAALESDLERTEAERIKLAERVSLLQAALAAKQSEPVRAEDEPAPPARAKVVELKPDRSAAAIRQPLHAEETERMIREREREIARLSDRWRELQGAYRDAVAEFDEVREKRDRLARHLGAPAAGEADAQQSTAAPPAPSRPAEVADLEVRQRDSRPPLLVHIDDPENHELGERLAASTEMRLVDDDAGALPADAEVVVAANLCARGEAALDVIAAIVGRGRVARALLYAADGQSSLSLGPIDVFVPPFDADGCASFLTRRYPRLRRAMAVGQAVESMSRLRELLGKLRCSTAVAFESKQAFELLPLVRPEYILIDLAAPNAAGIELIADLATRPDGSELLGVTWSHDVDPDAVRAVLSEHLAAGTLDPADLERDLRAMLAS